MLMEKDLLSINDLTAEEIKALLDEANKIKRNPKEYENALHRKVVAMVFEFPSLRTKASFAVAMYQMGGHVHLLRTPPLEIFPENLRNLALWGGDAWAFEAVKDQARVLSRYVNAIVARTRSHTTLEMMAKYSSVPVINAESNYHHPCQTLADLLTIKEKKKKFEGLKVTCVGNLGVPRGGILMGLITACAKLGMDATACCPEEEDFLPTSQAEKPLWDSALEDAKKTGARLEINHDPYEAVKDADIVYSDIFWLSVDDMTSLGKSVVLFSQYQVNQKLVEHAKPDAIVMHCLPANRGIEITSKVMDGPHSVVYDQAENRLHAQKAILISLIK